MNTAAPIATPNVELLGIAKLVAHSVNRALIEDDLVDLVDLTKSLESQLGLLQYPVVVPLDDGGHRIIVGHSRIMSARQLGWTKIPCIIRDDLDDAAELLALLEDNDRHRPLAVSDRARIDTELSLFPEYDTPEKIADATGRDHKQVAGALAVYRLGAAACRAADADQLNLDDALTLDELRATDPATVDKILAKPTTAVSVRYAIEEAQRKHRKATVLTATRAELTATGVTVVNPPRGFPFNSKVAPLDKLYTAEGQEPDPEVVKTQEGYGAVVEVGYRMEPKITYVCLDPEAAGLRRNGGFYVSPEQEKARAEQTARKAELREQLATAAELRLRWLRGQLGTQAKAATWLPDALRLLVVAGGELFADTAADDLCARPDQPERATDKRITHRVVAQVIMTAHEWAREPFHPHDASLLVRFYDLVRCRGYALTDIEQQQYDQCAELLMGNDSTAAG